jgi:hypothetical protein
LATEHLIKSKMNEHVKKIFILFNFMLHFLILISFKKVIKDRINFLTILTSPLVIVLTIIAGKKFNENQLDNIRKVLLMK